MECLWSRIWFSTFRFLPNPNFVKSLKDKTGLDQEVADYVRSFSTNFRIAEAAV